MTWAESKIAANYTQSYHLNKQLCKVQQIPYYANIPIAVRAVWAASSCPSLSPLTRGSLALNCSSMATRHPRSPVSN